MILIDFDTNNDLNFYYSQLKTTNFQNFLKVIKWNNYKILNEKNLREIGKFYSLDQNNNYQNEINKNEIFDENNKDKENKKDILKNLVELYFYFDNLSFHLKENYKAILKHEKYYLINKEWIN